MPDNLALDQNENFMEFLRYPIWLFAGINDQRYSDIIPTPLNKFEVYSFGWSEYCVNFSQYGNVDIAR